MRQQLNAFAIACLLLFSQTLFAQVTQVKHSTSLNMRGAYTMLKQTLDSGNGASVLPVQQLKIYTDKYIMYAHRRSEADSLAEFGVGTYKVENGKVLENMFYGSSGPVNGKFELTITKGPDGYSQLIDFPSDVEGKHYLLTEDYKTSDNKMRTPLDGAWKQTRAADISKDGKMTPSEGRTQFKFFESGNFMWANTGKNKDGKYEAYYGYGFFEMPKPGLVTETATSSSFTTALVGRQINLSIKFLSKDSYQQTITWGDGSKSIETYERMK